MGRRVQGGGAGGSGREGDTEWELRGDGRELEIDGEGWREKNNKREVGEGESEGEGQEGGEGREGRGSEVGGM